MAMKLEFWGRPVSAVAAKALMRAAEKALAARRSEPVPEWDRDKVTLREGAYVPTPGEEQEVEAVAVFVQDNGTADLVLRFKGVALAWWQGGARRPEPPCRLLPVRLHEDSLGAAAVANGAVAIVGDDQFARTVALMTVYSGYCSACGAGPEDMEELKTHEAEYPACVTS